MTWAGLDKRQFPRVSMKCDISIQGRFPNPLHAHTQNMGVGGVCVILKDELERFSNVHLQLALNENPPIQCDGRVVWKVKSKEPASGKVSFDTGIEFVNLKDQDKEKIEQFLSKRNQSA